MYITNNEEIARICDETGVDRVFIDLEKIGKADRQKGWNSVQSNHSISDIAKVKNAVKRTQVLVRINPIHENSKEEIENVLKYKPDVIMLPYFKSADEVKKFIDYVDGRARTNLLFETKEAVDNIDEILMVRGIDEIHIGLNDLSHSYNHRFLFQPFNENIVDYIISRLKTYGISRYGIGGIAKIGYGLIPAEDVICEHYRLGSTCAILSRAFCNTEKITDIDEIKKVFDKEVKMIRRTESRLQEYCEKDKNIFEYHRNRFNEKVKRVIQNTYNTAIDMKK